MRMMWHKSSPSSHFLMVGGLGEPVASVSADDRLKDVFKVKVKLPGCVIAFPTGDLPGVKLATERAVRTWFRIGLLDVDDEPDFG